MTEPTPSQPADRSSDRPAGSSSDTPDGHGGRDNSEALVDSRDRGSFARYRVMAFITGGFLLLLVVEMFLKYALQLNGVQADGSAAPVLGNWIAFVHGWIYVVYLVSVFDLWSRMRWGFGRIVALIAGGVVPVLSFVMERNARTWFEETLAARHGSGETPAEDA
ncbi:DUF3817 domain-containing protein [Pseudactinotalea sp. Z1748]|uniref:DUF3817 domain-containing protein n=1 Tax=Pseudactinotalea sp. Z1748 TaxID=3413027 RepID=UPI003C7EA7D2